MAEDRLGPIVESAINKLVTTAATSGYFDRTMSVEPKSGPATGLTFATWLTSINPIAPRSGLAVTSARVLMMYRIYSPMLAEPQDLIDVALGKASSYLLAQLTGDFTIDGAWIDLLGAHGVSLSTEYAYVELDRSMYRVADTTVPFIADDVFDQEV